MNPSPTVSVLAYKREVHSKETISSENELDAFQLWTRFLLCPIVMPCICCIIFCLHKDEPVVPTNTDGANNNDGHDIGATMTPFEKICHQYCSCLFEMDEVHNTNADDATNQPRIVMGGNKRAPPVKKMVYHKLGTLVARTDKFRNMLQGHWDGNIFIPNEETQAANEETTALLTVESSSRKAEDDSSESGEPLGRRAALLYPKGSSSPSSTKHPSSPDAVTTPNSADRVLHDNILLLGSEVPLPINNAGLLAADESTQAIEPKTSAVESIAASPIPVVETADFEKNLLPVQKFEGFPVGNDESIVVGDVVSLQPTVGDSLGRIESNNSSTATLSPVEVDHQISREESPRSPVKSLDIPTESVRAAMGFRDTKLFEKISTTPVLREDILVACRNSPTLEASKMFNPHRETTVQTYVSNDPDDMSILSQDRSTISYHSTAPQSRRAEFSRVDHLFQDIRTEHVSLVADISSFGDTGYFERRGHDNGASGVPSRASDIVVGPKSSTVDIFMHNFDTDDGGGNISIDSIGSSASGVRHKRNIPLRVTARMRANAN